MKLNQSHSRSSSTLLVVLLLVGTTFAQVERPTIPEILARAGGSTSGMRMVGSGPPPTISDILKETDTEVRGLVGKPRSYLSDDQREVYTDYPLNPSFVYQSVVVTSTKPGMPTVTVTLPGGSITINGLTYTFKDLGLPPLEPGMEGLFLLRRVGDRYRIACRWYGAFRISAEKVTPLTGKQGFALEYRDARAAEVAADIVARLRRHPQ